MYNFTSKCWSFFVMSIVALSLKSNAQSKICGTPSPSKEEKTRSIELRNQYNRGLKSARTDTVKGLVYIPVRPHIVRKNDKSGGLPLFDLNNSLAICNKFYLNAGKGIQFYIAGTEPNYVDDSTLYEFNSGKKDASGKTMEERITAKNAVKNAVNVYFVGSLLADGKSLAGYAYFPTREASSNTCVMLNGQTNDNSTFAHEFGHYFNLYHTFQSNNDTIPERELVTRLVVEPGKRKPANCDAKGDLICDTPSDPFDRKPKVNSCVYADTTLKDANGDIFEPIMGNIMNYFECNNDSFTPQQYSIMGGFGLNERLNPANEYFLSGSKAWQPSVVKAPFLKKPTYKVMQGVTVAWKDSSSNETGFFIERATSLKGPFLGVGGTAPNDTVFVDKTVASNQKYYYRIKPSNTTVGSLSNVDSLVTGAVYCKPTYSFGCGDGDGKGNLDVFMLQGDSTMIKNEKSLCSTAAYGDFTNLSTQLTAGKKYKVTLGTSLGKDSTFYSLNSAIWVDFNKDGIFTGTKVGEGSEMVYQGKMVTGDNVLVDSLRIPKTALAGSTRMRVRVQRITGGPVLSACDNYFTGETEDYSVSITNAKPDPTPVAYCMPTYTYPCVKGGQLLNFSLKADSLSINNGDTTCAGGYNNYRSNTSAMVKAGKKYPISIKMSSDSTTLPYIVGVWADFNGDGVFTGSEKGKNSEFLLQNITTVKGTLSDTLNIPIGVKSGNYVLRVRTQRASYGAVADACERYTYGSTGDFTIVVKDTSTKKGGRVTAQVVPEKVSEFRNENDGEGALVYPNPTDGSFVYVRVNNAEEAHLALFNSLGNEIPTLKGIISQYVVTLKPTQNIASGAYFVSIVEDGKRVVQKVMVVK
jgi:GEVED domain/Pregnancy-associated plasma protein-A/Secretion system C-terminal sorting domain